MEETIKTAQRMSSVSLTEITSAIESVENLTIKNRYKNQHESDNSSKNWGTTRSQSLSRISRTSRTPSQMSVTTTNSKMLETLNDMAEYFIKSTLNSEIIAGQILAEAVNILKIEDKIVEKEVNDKIDQSTQTASGKIYKFHLDSDGMTKNEAPIQTRNTNLLLQKLNNINTMDRRKNSSSSSKKLKYAQRLKMLNF